MLNILQNSLVYFFSPKVVKENVTGSVKQRMNVRLI